MGHLTILVVLAALLVTLTANLPPTSYLKVNILQSMSQQAIITTLNVFLATRYLVAVLFADKCSFYCN